MEDAQIKAILKRVKTVAIVGVSAKPVRPSYFVARYLQIKGFRIVPVNPGLAGQVLLGETVHATLSDVPVAVDMVDVFRKSDAVPGIVEEALARWSDLDVIWLQLGVQHDVAAAVATARGVTVVQDRCPKIEYQRLFGELRMGGFNTGVISSKL